MVTGKETWLATEAPRGSFTLRSGDNPIVLLSAGVGATPVLAMLHALASESSPREVWWLFGARYRQDHAFAEESASLIKLLPQGKSCIWYSRPSPQDRPGADFDRRGRITAEALGKIDVPSDADFYLCGPAAFLKDLTVGLMAMGVPDGRVHAEIFGTINAITPGIAATAHIPPHPPELRVEAAIKSFGTIDRSCE